MLTLSGEIIHTQKVFANMEVIAVSKLFKKRFHQVNCIFPYFNLIRHPEYLDMQITEKQAACIANDYSDFRDLCRRKVAIISNIGKEHLLHPHCDIQSKNPFYAFVERDEIDSKQTKTIRLWLIHQAYLPEQKTKTVMDLANCYVAIVIYQYSKQVRQ